MTLTLLHITDEFNRGYESLRSQTFEKNGRGDLKEGFYFGRDLPLHDPKVQAKKFGQGPNKYPEEVSDPQAFRSTVDAYHNALSKLAEEVLMLLAETLDLDSQWFSNFCKDPAPVLRLLHYPPQPPDAPEQERGVSCPCISQRLESHDP